MKLTQLKEGATKDPIRSELWKIILRVLREHGYERGVIHTDRSTSAKNRNTPPEDGSNSKIGIGSGKHSKIKFRVEKTERSKAVSRLQLNKALNIAIQREFNSKYTPAIQLKDDGYYFQVYKRTRDSIKLKSQE